MPSGCVRWQCAELFGQEECLHYVKRPEDVKVELLSDNSSETDSVVVSWKPNFYGETPKPPALAATQTHFTGSISNL